MSWWRSRRRIEKGMKEGGGCWLSKAGERAGVKKDRGLLFFGQIVDDLAEEKEK